MCDKAHNSVLRASLAPRPHDSFLAHIGSLAQPHDLHQQVDRELRDGLEGAASASSDAPPLVALAAASTATAAATPSPFLAQSSTCASSGAAAAAAAATVPSAAAAEPPFRPNFPVATALKQPPHHIVFLMTPKRAGQQRSQSTHSRTSRYLTNLMSAGARCANNEGCSQTENE